MRRCALFFVFTVAGLLVGDTHAHALTTVADVLRCTRGTSTNVVDFAVSAVCVRVFANPDGCRLIIRDETGFMPVYRHSPYSPEQREFDATVVPGDRIRLSGTIMSSTLSGWRLAYYDREKLLSHGPPPVPHVPTQAELATGDMDFRLVRVKGQVLDVYHDILDPRYLHILFLHGGEPLLMPHRVEPPIYTASRNLIGQHLSVVGICNPAPISSRRQVGRNIEVSRESDIVWEPFKPFDFFATPSIEELRSSQPEQIAKAGWHRLSGRVLAVWNGRSLLLLTDPFHVSRVELTDGQPPHCGDTVTVAGLPTTDLTNINLLRAIWKPADQPVSLAQPAVLDLSIREFTVDDAGRSRYNDRLHGKLVRIRGKVLSGQKAGGIGDPTLRIEDNGAQITISAGVLPDLPEPGSVVSLTGICVMESADWRPNIVFPQTQDVRIVLRSPDDLVVRASPPWWTPRRLFWLTGILLAILVAVTVWNYSLHLLAERRGKALFAERARRFGAVERTNERTRIAVELHDSLSQSLTGISMELETAARNGTDAPPAMMRHLSVALRTLKSCHTELRRCLWDLRSQALEETTMDKAIKRTLLPVVKSNRLDVRFNVRRDLLPDDTAHMVLRVIRELVSNAIVHGKADVVKVAGGLDGDRLVYSVRDNGCGFDPDDCPGVLQGHFGLQGIRERLSRFKGKMSVDSRPGNGVRVAVTMDLKSSSEGNIA